jgi:tRNA-Thr(GGU) m(6)t(6)A37 methyltransferase TsaA
MSRCSCNTLLLGVATTAVILSIISWTKLREAKKELQELQSRQQTKSQNSELSKQPSSSSSSCSSKTDSSHCRQESTKSTTTSSTTTRQPNTNDALLDDSLTVRPIGTIRSVYRLCVGTPRQGLLAPSARGCIQLYKLGDASIQEAVSGLEEFSYIWILFVFHLNTRSSSANRRFKSKISPPALGGRKVGVYATRSPHRANPIGITLCKLDRIQVDGPHRVTLFISGLDLVDGTPVLDVKPYVPTYDSVIPFTTYNASEKDSVLSSTTQESLTTSTITQQQSQLLLPELPPVRVPDWVDGGLKTFRPVTVTDRAKHELQAILQNNPNALEFYGPHHHQAHRDKDTDAFTEMLRCITQVLAMDVRSSYQTQKSRKGQFQAECAQRMQSSFGLPRHQSNHETNNDDDDHQNQSSNVCTQQLDNLLIGYRVEQTKELRRGTSKNSGAEDVIVVESIQLLMKQQKS